MQNDCIEKDKQWVEKLKTPQVKFYLKTGGSEFSDNPYLRTEQVFNKKFQMQKLIKVMFENKHVCKWDKNVKSRKLIEVTKGKKSYNLQFLVNK